MEYRIDICISDLCEEVDKLNNAVKHWKGETEYWKNLYNDFINKSLKSGEEQMGQWLTLLLNSEQTDRGLLIKQINNK